MSNQTAENIPQNHPNIVTAPTGVPIRPCHDLAGYFAGLDGSVWTCVVRRTYLDPTKVLLPVKVYRRPRHYTVYISPDPANCPIDPKNVMLSHLVLEAWIGPGHGRTACHAITWTEDATGTRVHQDNGVGNLFWSAPLASDNISPYFPLPIWTMPLTLKHVHPGWEFIERDRKDGYAIGTRVAKQRKQFTLQDQYRYINHPQLT